MVVQFRRWECWFRSIDWRRPTTRSMSGVAVESVWVGYQVEAKSTSWYHWAMVYRTDYMVKLSVWIAMASLYRTTGSHSSLDIMFHVKNKKSCQLKFSHIKSKDIYRGERERERSLLLVLTMRSQCFRCLFKFILEISSSTILKHWDNPVNLWLSG